MSKTKIGLLCAALAALYPAMARADNQFYAGVNGDVAFPQHSAISGGAKGTQSYGFSSGGDLSLGFQPAPLDFGDKGDMRFELQGGYHALGLDKMTVGGVTNNNPKGDVKAATLMANAFYDIPTGTPFTPYIGAGAGYAHVTIPGGNGLANTTSGDNRFAWQGMAGVAYTAPALPKADWTLGYRFLGIQAPSYSSAGGGIKISPIHESAVELGLRYHF